MTLPQKVAGPNRLLIKQNAGSTMPSLKKRRGSLIEKIRYHRFPDTRVSMGFHRMH